MQWEFVQNFVFVKVLGTKDQKGSLLSRKLDAPEFGEPLDSAEFPLKGQQQFLFLFSCFSGQMSTKAVETKFGLA